MTGDVATVGADGAIELLGRGSVSINTGGEKVHPEEVESTLKAHPGVYDCLVVGRARRAVGQCGDRGRAAGAGAVPTLADLAAHCRASLAGYKAPKHLVVVDTIVRSPSGKADYRWAKETAEKSVPAQGRVDEGPPLAGAAHRAQRAGRPQQPVEHRVELVGGGRGRRHEDEAPLRVVLQLPPAEGTATLRSAEQRDGLRALAVVDAHRGRVAALGGVQVPSGTTGPLLPKMAARGERSGGGRRRRGPASG